MYVVVVYSFTFTTFNYTKCLINKLYIILVIEYCMTF